MAAVTIDLIKALRERTGAGMMDCKRALQEKDGDLEAAVDYLREKGIAKAATKATRIAAEGLTNVKFCEKCNKGIIVEVNCETDFVSSSDKFHKLVDDVTALLLKKSRRISKPLRL
jgi:elongation factor Ts